jgi:hypothetical protein
VSLLGWPTSACPDPSRGLVDGALLRVAAVLGTTFGLALVLRADRESLLVRWPRRVFRPWIPIGFAGAFVVSLIVLHWSFRGTLTGALSGADVDPTGLVLALGYGLAFGLTQEIAYRGALLAWSSRVIGVGAAIVGQALIVGLAMTSRLGTWSVSAVEPAWISASALALLAGVIAVRTRSLAITLAVQCGIGVAWYLVVACDW